MNGQWNETYCPTSPHEQKLHGVRPSQRGDTQGQYTYGLCTHCKQTVRANIWDNTPWAAQSYLIEEEPV